MLTSSFLRQVEVSLGQKLRQKLHIKRVTPLSGGSINLSAKIDTSAGVFFMKANDAFRYPLMFENEAKGLSVLSEAAIFTVPEVIMTGEAEGQAFIILKFIESKLSKMGFWECFGVSLAKIHRFSAQRYGFTEDNYIGSLRQSNKEHNNWADFFIEERIEKQLAIARRNGTLLSEDVDRFKRVYSKIDSLIPIESPALLHGDLWNGNYITGSEGEPCLIDPAIYYGHREMDISMTRLFGGFDPAFYDAYHAEFPLAPGFEERSDIHNLYPLLVHINLFGGDYIKQVRSILRRFN